MSTIFESQSLVLQTFDIILRPKFNLAAWTDFRSI